MFREIRRTERLTEEDIRRREEEKRRNQRYLEIEPETNITTEESVAFWQGLFTK